MHLNNYLNSKFLQFTVITALFTLLVNAHAAWEVQPKLGYNLTPLPKPVPAPQFTLEDMDEEKHSLEDLRGKVILLNFWATWCPPCRREMPSMQRLYEKYQGRGLVVVAVNQWEDADHVFAYTGDLNVFPSFPILFDPESKVSQQYGVKGLPTSFVIDRAGRLVYRAIGGTEKMRKRAMRQATVFLMLDVMMGLVHMLRRDGKLWNLRLWWQGWKFLFFEGGLLRRVWPAYREYFRDGFHPWQRDTRELLQAWQLRQRQAIAR